MNISHLAPDVLEMWAGDCHRSNRTGRSLSAAFLNAASGNVFDFDDTHLRTVIHPTSPVVPALFALAEMRPVSGRDLLHAFALGVEIECRLGNAISPEHYARGWHITSTCGTLGAVQRVASCYLSTQNA